MKEVLSFLFFTTFVAAPAFCNQFLCFKPKGTYKFSQAFLLRLADTPPQRCWSSFGTIHVTLALSTMDRTRNRNW